METMMDAFRLILLLLASSRYFLHPIEIYLHSFELNTTVNVVSNCVNWLTSFTTIVNDDVDETCLQALWLLDPQDGAIRSEKPTNEEERNNILSSVPVSVKDVLAQTGGNALLPCRFTSPGIVTWIRRKDRQLLTLGTDTHVIDTRFMVISNSPDWTLLIKNVQREDAGLYECQIQTEPVQQRFIRLSITEAYSMIPGGPDLHIKQGSSLRLECQLIASTEAPSFIFWYREGRMINYDDEPGVKVEATKNGSILVVDKVKLSHGANYTCWPSNARPAYIMIHVIEEEEKPAAMHGGDRRNATSKASINVMLIFLTFLGIRTSNRLHPRQTCVT